MKCFSLVDKSFLDSRFVLFKDRITSTIELILRVPYLHGGGPPIVNKTVTLEVVIIEFLW